MLSIKFFINMWLYMVLAFTLAGLAHAKESSQGPHVVVTQAQQRLMAPQNEYPGKVISRQNAQIPSQVEGHLLSVVEVGAHISQGEPLAQLDEVLIRTALHEEESSVAREEARIEFLQAEVKRLQRLVKMSNAAQTSLDQAISNLAVARSERAAAGARVQQAQERLTRARIIAPFDGIITERYKQQGEWLDTGDPVVRLVNNTTLEVQVWAPQAVFPYVRPGKPVAISLHDTRQQGEVSTIVPVGDSRSHLYELRISVAGEQWSSGSAVRVWLPTAMPREVLTVHRDALVLRRDGASVFRILQDNSAEKISVTTGVAAGDFIEVSGSLQAGDRVVIRGGERLRPGQVVQVSDSSASAGNDNGNGNPSGSAQ